MNNDKPCHYASQSNFGVSLCGPREAAEILTALSEGHVIERYNPIRAKWEVRQDDGRIPNFNRYAYRVSGAPRILYAMRFHDGTFSKLFAHSREQWDHSEGKNGVLIKLIEFNDRDQIKTDEKDPRPEATSGKERFEQD